MSGENGIGPALRQTDAERIYALLYRLVSDVARLETLVRAMKKEMEEKKHE